MRDLIAKKARRRCFVRGCKNVVDVFALTRTRECGNSVIMCMECAKGAYAAMALAKGEVPSAPAPVEAPAPAVRRKKKVEE